MNSYASALQSYFLNTGRFTGLVVLASLAISGVILLSGASQIHQVTATALFEIARISPSISGLATTEGGEQSFELLKKTQLALLKSNFVLSAALRNPAIGTLPLLKEQPDPVNWLSQHLVLKFPEDGEVLSISLSGSEEQSEALLHTVDAVAKAYKDEVIDDQRQRNLLIRDLLSRNIEDVNKDTKRKLAEYFDLVRKSGSPEADRGNLQLRLIEKRLDRVESEIMRLEISVALQPNAEGGNRKAAEDRIGQLRKQQAELEKYAVRISEQSPELEFRKHEFESRQKTADELSLDLARLDVYASAPDRIRQLQPAVISHN
jgi:hypothetical protein